MHMSSRRCPGSMHMPLCGPAHVLRIGGCTSRRCQSLESLRRAPNSRSRRKRCVETYGSVVWRQVEETGAWVAHSRRARSKGIVHFLGGAFVGAAPQLSYNLLCTLVADAGYTVITTPYQVTFKHEEAAAGVRQQLLDTLSSLRAAGRSYLVPPTAPIHGMGHSNGALLQLLMACDGLPNNWRSNCIISYNSRQVTEAIPIPGLLDGLSTTSQQDTTSGAGLTAGSSSSGGAGWPQVGSAEQVLQLLASSPPAGLALGQNTALLAGATPALEQLGSVVQEVQSGYTDFVPDPVTCRAIIGSRYVCPATLLVRFANDTLDDSRELEGLLSSRVEQLQERSATAGSTGLNHAESLSGSNGGPTMGGNGTAQQTTTLDVQSYRLESLVLPGNHLTPCGGDLVWEVGPVYTPVDAVLQAAKASSQADLRQLVARLLDWMDAAGANSGAR